MPHTTARHPPASSHRCSASVPMSDFDGLATVPMSSSGVAANTSLNEQEQARRLHVLIDKVAIALDLSSRYRAELHKFQDIVQDLDPAFWRVTIIQQATMFKSLDYQETILNAISETKDEIQQTSKQLTKKQFELEKDQSNEILALCRQLIFDPARERFDFAEEAFEMLKDAAKYPVLAEYIRNKTKSKVILSVVRGHATTVRKEYRASLVMSVLHPHKRCGLTQCVQENAKRCGIDTITPDMVLRIAIMRQYIREHRDIVAVTEDEPDIAAAQ
ncbi:hypothetical protein BD414DRAFT_578903, partial [Trametes punicea]